VPALALAALVWAGRNGWPGRLVAWGLLTSAGADVAIEGSFLAGVGLFLLAHVLYVAAFVTDERALCAWRGLPFALYAASMYAFLRPRLGALAVPVGAYVVAIAAMMWRAAARVRAAETAGRWALFGALAFGLSDSLLALHRFHQPLPGASVAIMLTYWTGQLGIALSVVSGPIRSARSRAAAAAPVASDTQAPASTDAR
jgi:alkenylglycerophosphocholine hydrolase